MDSLRAVAKESPKKWLDPTTDFHEVLTSLNVTDYLQDTGLRSNGPISMPSAEHLGRTSKARGDLTALKFRENIPDLTPAHLADPNLLAWMSCFHLLEFGISRWPTDNISDLSRWVEQHYLAETRRPITDASISGRTLWLSEITRRAAASSSSFTAEQILQHFCDHPEDYHNCSSNYYIMRSPMILGEYVRALLTEAQGINRTGSREIARDLNRAAGARLIDALQREELREIISASTDRLMAQPKYVADRAKLRGRKNLQVLSLGAGVQSTVMALMAEQGYDGFAKPDLAIFADTGWEPKAVYQHLNWLEQQLSFPVTRVNNGNIRDNILQGINPEGRKFIDMPVFVIKDDGKTYVGTRQCTRQYKLKPIQRHLRQHMGLQPGKVAPIDQQVDMWLGLSIDEASRVKPSTEAWITNVYPLLDRQMSRAQLINWFEERYPGRRLPKSACIGCPYHTDRMWLDMKQNDPESFQDAVNVEWAMQNVPQSRGSLTGTAFLHKSRVPLAGVEFNTTITETDAMQQECEGLCGI